MQWCHTLRIPLAIKVTGHFVVGTPWRALTVNADYTINGFVLVLEFWDSYTKIQVPTVCRMHGSRVTNLYGKRHIRKPTEWSSNTIRRLDRVQVHERDNYSSVRIA